MTWKKLLAGGAGGALLVGWAVSLTDCTVCKSGDPNCVFTGTDSGGKDSATEGSSGDGGATCSAIKPQGPIFFDDATGTGPCDKCMTAKCCTEAQACVAQKPADGSMDTCTDYLGCIDVCTFPDGGIDQACVNACGQTDPMGKAVAATMFTCLQTKCTTECK